MYRIAQKKTLNPTVTQMDIEAPYARRKSAGGTVHYFACP